jgi:hypothetical protein
MTFDLVIHQRNAGMDVLVIVIQKLVKNFVIVFITRANRLANV